MMAHKRLLTDQQIAVLAKGWPWDFGQVERALRLAEKAGWPLDDTVRGLDALAEDWGADADPEAVVDWAIRWKREHGDLSTPPGVIPRWEGPS